MAPVTLEECKQQTVRLEKYPFEPVRRVVTGHSKEGQAFIWKDEPVKPLPVTMTTGEAAVFAHPWTTDAGKYDLNDDRDLSLLEDNSKLSNDNGCVVRVTDMPPNSISPNHRTVSLDYGILFKGSVILHLDNGVKTTIKEGDIVVQRGTIHAWENPTDEYARMYFFLLAAKPFLVDGKPLGDAGYEKAH